MSLFPHTRISSIRASRLAFLLALVALPAAAQFGMAGPKVGFTIESDHASAAPGDTVRVAIQFTLEEPWHVNSHTPLEEFLIPTELQLGASPAVSLGSVVYPEHKELTFEFSPTPLAVYEAQFTVGAELVVAADAAPGEVAVPLSLYYQACNDKQCAPPKTLDLPFKLTIGESAATEGDQKLLAQIEWNAAAATTASADDAAPEVSEGPATAEGDWRELISHFRIGGQTGYSSTADFLAFIEQSQTGEGGPAQDGFAGKSIWLILLSVFAGGFLLNLTPCVLPLIPINIGIIGAGARAGSKARGFALGAMFGLGIALAYGALGLLVVLGLSNAFGAMNATVWFNGGIAVLFAFLALGMFDVISIDFSRYQAKFGIRSNQGGSFGIAFAMGVISALLAGACVAPVVIQTIIYAAERYAEGVTLALALPFLLGLGMALPWPFAGAGLSFLPKPGGWMTRVKQAFGVFILAFAAYYAYTAWHIYDQQNVDPAEVVASVAHADEEGWVSSLEAGLAQAQAENKPVFIDFWATWCKNCLVMNNTVLKDPEVLQALDGFVKIKFQAENPSASPVKDVWEHFKLVGLPAYFILLPE
ncbi:MAG: DUF255 domain-containing protein [Candidatus Hydrogenedens sp.]|nr:DUF255 domain-containing protein [Candidatus Hydrogenedens sp.]